ncbi:RecQ family ATP-dependent DNA helicase [Proteiniclasticum sp. C24MP]|uniref:RecQ family ATP-dependent DNA helicase n=1 Tax=Proteiniclasticum sp. C24MP TaxID=3374101 RepID=UPI00375492EC
MEPQKILKKYFGLNSFKKEQISIIKEILSGRDVVGILPTGYGKSLCYQVPSMMMKGPTLVISPLISLMKDQVDALKDRGIPATYINSSLSLEESNERKRNIRKGKYKLIYVSPESLKLKRFTDLLRDIGLAQIAVDEAHCISIWGHDFRPSYLTIDDFIRTLEKRPVITAFTATATEAVKTDILELLHLEDAFSITGDLNRENIYFGVKRPQDEVSELLIQINERKGQQGIIYCQRKKEAEKVRDLLQQEGHKAGLYHGGLEDAVRRKVQEDFSFDRIHIVVATSAFGMGIDKSNVRYVIHLGIPKNIESFYQEAGRAGRDQSYSESILIYRPGDSSKQNRLLQISDLTKERYEIEREKLVVMDQYGKTENCLRAFVLNYFKGFPPDDAKENCGNCSNCIEEGRINLTVLGRKIIAAMRILGERSEAYLVYDFLLGSRSRELEKRGYCAHRYFGSLKNHKKYYLDKLMSLLEKEAYLVKHGEQLSITEKGNHLLQGEGEFIVLREEGEEKQDYHEELLLRLKRVRREISRMEGIAPYIIFHDETLRDIARKIPVTKKEFMEVRGVGRTKALKYGHIFLEEIRKYGESQGKLEEIRKEIQKDPEHTIDQWDTFSLHKEGKTVEEMATILGIVQGTVVDRLIREHDKGRDVNLDALYKSHLEQQILHSVQKLGTDKLRPIKEDLMREGIDVDYIDIKVIFYKHYGIRKK